MNSNYAETPNPNIPNGFDYGESNSRDEEAQSEPMSWPSALSSRSHSTARENSPRLSNLSRSNFSSPRSSHILNFDWKNFWREVRSPNQQRFKRKCGRRLVKENLLIIGLVGLFFLTNWWMISRLQEIRHYPRHLLSNSNSSSSSFPHSSSVKTGELRKFEKGKRPNKGIYARLLALAAHALAEEQNKPEPKDLWMEPLAVASAWKPCADHRNWVASEGNNRYIMVSANGGLNQQRVAICNAVAVARLLNSTLVIPKFLYSSVWRDVSQFGDIYQEEHFINYLKPDIRIVKELPKDLQSLDLGAIGSVVTDSDIMKEAKPSFLVKYILPILLQNRVVQFVGFANRLAFDPIPSHVQRLRCRCNFHALQFVPKIQKTGALLLQKIRQHIPHEGLLDRHLVGPLGKSNSTAKRNRASKASKYLALHMRFEIDMVAHSLCEFGGGEEERRELEAYRKIHFPALTVLEKANRLPSPTELRSEGLCPLTPEESVLMLAALGFNRRTHIFLAGSQIYGGKSRWAPLRSLYPNLVTKEELLSPSEIEPFLNFSSQLAALDYIACTAADAFAMTDPGSQLSSLVSGYRMYYGGGRMPTIRPNKRRLSSIFLKNSTIEWRTFQLRMRKAVRQTKRVIERPTARSIYRHPRCSQCMCFAH